MKEKINVSFFGSSNFSIPTLKELLTNEKIQLKSNIVQDFAINNGFDEKLIFTPNTLKNNNELIEKLKNQQLDFIVVVAYGKIITKEIIEIPKKEILNLHPSNLPKYRGAAPIERAIENGEKEIDICIMKVDVGLDTGDVCLRKNYKIEKTKTCQEILPEVALIGAKLMLTAIEECYLNKAVFEPQTNYEVIYANKITKDELFLDLSQNSLMQTSAEKVFNKIRAFNNCGCCYFILDNKRIKIINAILKKNNEKNMINNNFTGFNKKTGEIVFQDGIIVPTLLQKESKNPVKLKDFLNGINSN